MIQNWRNRTTIRKQLSIVVGLATALSITLLIGFNYATQANANVRQQIDALSRVLGLENQRLENYVSDLRTFSLQLRGNSGFMEIAAQTTPLSYSQRQTVETALKTLYYSRSDLTRVELYLVRQKQQYVIEATKRKVSLVDGVDVTTLPDYDRFTAKPDFSDIRPDDKGLLCFTRTIIDSPRETPLAVMRLTVSNAAVTPLFESHSQSQESLCVFGANDERYAVDAGLSDADADMLLAGVRADGGSFTAAVGGAESLCVAESDSGSGFVLVASKPMKVVNAALITTRNYSILLGLAALAFSVLLVIAFIRYITEPLSNLAHRLRRVGSGNFKTKASLEGSYEIIGLSEDVNHMMTGINSLIDRTYVATLNERTAQLAALEAQTNPHFLFNTLQAIGSEALARGQKALYNMVTALGMLLRYSIKGGNLSTLQTELSYVEKYLSLQKARFGDRLTYHIHVEDAMAGLSVPKLGVLSLVENSIVHGLRGEVTNIHIELAGTVDSQNVRFTVSDDGCGIPLEKLAELRPALNDPTVTISQNIGLMNLASRLKLLYNGLARLEITSEPSPRLTTVTLTIPLEVIKHVQSIDD
ncbi:MAG: sensor histidine kinase [Eubacteriales bacterium]|nr:sensor histidine kinase [Eubacteriales bacterium]